MRTLPNEGVEERASRDLHSDSEELKNYAIILQLNAAYEPPMDPRDGTFPLKSIDNRIRPIISPLVVAVNYLVVSVTLCVLCHRCIGYSPNRINMTPTRERRLGNLFSIGSPRIERLTLVETRTWHLKDITNGTIFNLALTRAEISISI
ncbi:uncharacterized protein BT62DRAFT_1007172 [Guyanagaster necrorhizus]|uniref:Uncharacterized protein n=1 Tax=Guyanagaster necrorhizus TaxID=856835 RepID=A0A9P7VRS9_9AGAR|nr:uncharacterized protein BT62DRAFT_1007172 [Guyanagaster necrorhizus MCA 3950]KAG7445422.1 hypothetical protein BT62DRAFT_1007172 [Guyanagaster necrorhizus MCA 3950]